MPLTDLTKKDIPFVWGPKQEESFSILKSKFKENVILRHFNWDKPARLETDASDRATSGILLQEDTPGIWKPAAFFSRKMSPAEAKYEICDKELLAIVKAFEEWGTELEETNDSIEVVTDHKALEYFMKSRLLSSRQARWSEFLSRFNFKICYRPGNQNGAADTLSRPDGDPDPALKSYLNQQLMKSHNLTPTMQDIFIQGHSLSKEKQLTHRSFLERIEKATLYDKSLLEIIKALESSDTEMVRKFTLVECNFERGLVYCRDRIVVPQSDYDDTLTTEIIKSYHGPPAAGHQGAAATYSTIARKFFWHGMLEIVTCVLGLNLSMKGFKDYLGLFLYQEKSRNISRWIL